MKLVLEEYMHFLESEVELANRHCHSNRNPDSDGKVVWSSEVIELDSLEGVWYFLQAISGALHDAVEGAKKMMKARPRIAMTTEKNTIKFVIHVAKLTTTQTHS